MPGILANYWSMCVVGTRYLRQVKKLSFDESHAFRAKHARELLARLEVKYTVDRPEALSIGRPCVFVANHTAMIDPLVLCCIFERDVRFLAKSPLFHTPLISNALKVERHIPVYRNSHTESTREKLKASVKQAFAEGGSVFFFPEGTRTATGELGPFKLGAFFSAVQNNVPVVPICIHGLFELNPKTGYDIHPGSCEIHVFDPIEVPDGADERERAQKLSDLSREVIANDLAQAKK